ncbi:MAG: glycosyltransferase family 4 protein [Cycloclasticus sp.]|jgi:glycosyltransferase involved in cell wall biosynthesis|nr:glycosyltransferase family 4 protein [Cycloclasticus sp.]
MATNILFISKSYNSSSTHYRALQFFPYLKSHGFKPKHVSSSGGLFAILKTLWLANQADVVIVLRKTFPLMITWLLRLVSKKLIFDFDDAIFCRSNGSISKTRMKRFKNIVSKSDHIFAGNQFLAHNSSKLNKSVSLIPTCLDVEKYNVKISKPTDSIDLVWIGSRSTSKYLLNLIPILDNIAATHPSLRLKVIADFDIPEAKIPTLIIPWTKSCEAYELVSSHIGIAPMIENDWTKGKCALKVLQYMAAGLPVISSNVGVNSEVITSNKNGFLVTTSDDWKEAIDTLVKDSKLRQSMGTTAHQDVINYDIKKVFNLILKSLHS